MTTSGTYTFNPSLGELVIYSYQNIAFALPRSFRSIWIRPSMATNMMLARWANVGVQSLGG